MQQSNESERWETDFRRWGNRSQPELGPFFYTRLQARLNQSVESGAWLPWWLRQPAYAYSAFVMLVLLNIGVVAGAAWWKGHDELNPQALTAPTISPLDDYDVDSIILAYE